MEHTSFPPLEVAPDSRTAWQQVARTIGDAIRSGLLSAGEQLPSAREMSDRYGLRLTTAQRALAALAEEGLIEVHQGRRAVVRAGTGAVVTARPTSALHNCLRSGCQPHVCKPMAAPTIKQIHAILSGTFSAAVRWEWIDRKPGRVSQAAEGTA